MPLLVSSKALDWVPQASGKEGRLADAIEMAESLAGAYCHRTLASASYTEYHDIGRDQTQVLLRQAPVVGTITFSVGDNGIAPTLQTVDDDYLLDADAGIVTSLVGSWDEGPRQVKVVYTAGYTSTTIPAALKRALYQLTAWLFETAGNAGAAQESMDGYSVTPHPLVDGVPADIAAMLDPYRRVVLG